jgi:hypothetical protein
VDGLLLQDWVTIQGSANMTVTQGEQGWLDVSAYDDVVFSLDVKNALISGGATTLNYETAPVPHDAAFVGMVPGLTPPAVGVTVTPALGLYANVPLAQYLRWRFTSTSTSFSVTFRLWIAAYSLTQSQS